VFCYFCFVPGDVFFRVPPPFLEQEISDYNTYSGGPIIRVFTVVPAIKKTIRKCGPYCNMNSKQEPTSFSRGILQGRGGNGQG